MERKKTVRLNWIAVLLVVVLLCSAAFLLARQIVQSQSVVLRNATILPARAGQAICANGEGVVYYDGASLHALNARGLQVWSYAAGTQASFDVGEGGVAVWSGTLLSLLSADQGLSLYSGNMEGEILDARLGTTYAAVQVGEEHDSTIVVMETGGRQVDRIELPDQTVLDFGFFNNGNLVWVMSLDTEGTVPGCSVCTYRPGRMLAGTITDTQQVLYEVLFQSAQIRTVGTTHIKDFDYTGKEIAANRMLVYGWYLIDIDEGSANPLMLFVPIAQADAGQSISDVRMIRGQTDRSVRLPYAAAGLFARGDTLYAFNGQYVMICRLDEERPRTYALPVYADSVLDITDGGAAVVSSGGSIYLVPLP